MTRDFRALLVITAMAILLVACEPTAEAPAAEPDPRPVKVIALTSSSNTISARYPAVIDALERAELSFLVGGIIQELNVNEAQDVAAGDVIARLDPRDFQSAVTAARASYNNAEEEYQRAVRLLAQDAIASNVVEQRETQRDVSQAQLEQAEKALEDAVLRAPFDGVVASVPATSQQTVAAGTPVATLISVGALEATINLPATDIARVPSRQNRSAAVILEAVPGTEIPAEFREADLVADAISQTYEITFAFKAPDDVLVLPGMNATVMLRATDSGLSESISVPLAAVQSDGEGQYVWVVDPNSSVVNRRNIEIAPGIGETVNVINGLSSDDRIVGAGGAYLAEGMRITPWTE
ncbi:MAG: efflux RND transporter periplasmic adaptor subunit [Pseudomonadota bacterium]